MKGSMKATTRTTSIDKSAAKKDYPGDLHQLPSITKSGVAAAAAAQSKTGKVTGSSKFMRGGGMLGSAKNSVVEHHHHHNNNNSAENSMINTSLQQLQFSN